MKILFLCDDLEDYLADSVLHGLKQMPDVYVVDYPRKEVMYKDSVNCIDFPEASLRGGGFTLYGLLEQDFNDVDRSQIKRRLESKWFDVVIIGNVWRQWGTLLELRQFLQDIPLILLDGDDDERLYPYSLTRLRQYGLGSFPREILLSRTTHYFKRELTQRPLSWKCRINLHPISFSIPREKVDPAVTQKIKKFTRHIVDSHISDIVGGVESYAFSDELSYRKDLRESRFGVTTKRAGWDCLRHYEIAASGTILCFKDLDTKPQNCAPSGLVSLQNCISYSSSSDLFRKIDNITEEQEQSMQSASLRWAMEKTTEVIARKMLCEALS